MRAKKRKTYYLASEKIYLSKNFIVHPCYVDASLDSNQLTTSCTITSCSFYKLTHPFQQNPTSCVLTQTILFESPFLL